MQPVYVAMEGLIDTSVVRRVCQEIAVEIAAVFGESGRDSLDGALLGYNAVRHA